MCLHPSNYLWPSACGPMVQMKPFVVSFAEQKNSPQILMPQCIFTVFRDMYGGESKTDINRKRKYTSSEEMLLYCLNMGVDMCAFVHVFGCRHIWKPGAILFLNQYCLFGGWDSIFHCARTHQEMVRLVGVGNPEIHLPGWHFLVWKLLLYKLFLVWVLRIELRSLACKVSSFWRAPEDT